MLKQYLLNSIIKEMKICRTLASKVPAEKIGFKLKDDTRSILELFHYLSFIGTGSIRYWYRTDGSDFKTFFGEMRSKSIEINTPEQFIAAMSNQVEQITALFDQISEDDLHTKIVDYPWGETAPLGQDIIETNIKWLTAYKLQLFSLIKHATEQKMGTPDAWRNTEITA